MTSCNTILWSLLIILPFGDRDIVSRAVEIQLYQIQITTSDAELLQTYTFKYIFILLCTKTHAQPFRKWWSEGSSSGVLPGFGCPSFVCIYHRCCQASIPPLTSSFSLKGLSVEGGENASKTANIVLISPPRA